jgi:quercetin dioxygenase-like cupin family protein
MPSSRSPLSIGDERRHAVTTRRGVLIGGSAIAIAIIEVQRAPALASEALKETAMDIDIKRNGSRPSQKGPEDWFTGTVRIDPLFAAPEPARVSGAQVTFEPGARTAWHTHPLGQTLIVTAGLGWVQREGGPVQEIRPGDVVWFPPGLKHWHGASATTAMTHIAIQESQDGRAVDWMEKVPDDQYRM